MKIQILGGGCPKCHTLEENTRQALANLSMEAEIVKVTDPDDIMNMGVMFTPALAIDGDVKSSGKVLTPEEVADILKAEGSV